MAHLVSRRWLAWATVGLVALIGCGVAWAQWRGPRYPPRFPPPGYASDGSFSFCRVEYDSVRYEELGQGWFTDYPDSDINFMIRLEELTTVVVPRDHYDAPDHWVIRLTDDSLFQFPFLFMSDVGTVGFRQEEVRRLREYLLRGGFLYVDDFWGEQAWYHWANEIGRVLPPEEYPIVDVSLDHELFSVFFEVEEMPQVPSIQHWDWTGTTSERGAESAVPHLRAIFDKSGRLMVLMTHNTDIADGWEREGQSREFFELFSVPKSYPLGVNIVLYGLTH